MWQGNGGQVGREKTRTDEFWQISISLMKLMTHKNLRSNALQQIVEITSGWKRKKEMIQLGAMAK